MAALILLAFAFPADFARADEWSDWMFIGNTDISFRNKWGTFRYEGDAYQVNFQVRNEYSQTVTFKVYLKYGDKKIYQGNFKLAPGEVGGSHEIIPRGANVSIALEDLQ